MTDFQKLPINSLTDLVLNACVEVHRTLGPGLLESVYEECVAHELMLRSIPCEQEVSVPITYKSLSVTRACRLDIVIAKRIVLELKAVDSLLPVHASQLRTYLRMTGLQVGLLVNFHGVTLRGQIRRVVHNALDVARPSDRERT